MFWLPIPTSKVVFTKVLLDCVQDSPYTAQGQVSPLFDNHHIELHIFIHSVDYVLETLLSSNTYNVRFSIWIAKIKSHFSESVLSNKSLSEKLLYLCNHKYKNHPIQEVFFSLQKFHYLFFTPILSMSIQRNIRNFRLGLTHFY